ncbi:Conserved membrane protein YfiD [hydrothermal vent metagenome]|uniref:Conserved membrane protein YfiD n=1 Tax=hydrothermal vent metagenome TaxID=652676 RepID=A0A1W1B9C8_9ZZZZ
MKNFLGECRILFSYPKNIVLLLSRLVIAYGFAVPALVKINDLEGTAKWFGSISIPFPTLTAYLVSGIETMGIILLILGLFTRYISILLGFVMLGAILFVHAGHGFSVAQNGIEIPLYYFIFLMLFASFGAGKYSMDRLLFGEGKDE